MADFSYRCQDTALHLLAYFLSLAAVLRYSLWRFHKNPSPSIGDVSPEKIRKKKLRVRASLAQSLAGLWRQRTNQVFRSCLRIAIPILFIALFHFSYYRIGIAYLGEAPEYELIIQNYQEGFTESDIAYVEAMQDVREVDTYRDSSLDYFACVTRELETLNLHPVRLRSLTSVGGGGNGKYEAALSKNCTAMEVSLGDTLQILSANTEGTIEDMTKGLPQLVVTDFLDVETADWAVDVYVSEELLSELMETIPVCELRIKLKDADTHQSVAQALQSRFPGAEYEIVDKQTSRDFVRQDFSSGIYLVLSYVFVILLLLVLLILYVKLWDYVNGCTGITRVLHIIGAKSGICTNRSCCKPRPRRFPPPYSQPQSFYARYISP